VAKLPCDQLALQLITSNKPENRSAKNIRSLIPFSKVIIWALQLIRVNFPAVSYRTSNIMVAGKITFQHGLSNMQYHLCMVMNCVSRLKPSRQPRLNRVKVMCLPLRQVWNEAFASCWKLGRSSPLLIKKLSACQAFPQLMLIQLIARVSKSSIRWVKTYLHFKIVSIQWSMQAHLRQNNSLCAADTFRRTNCPKHSPQDANVKLASPCLMLEATHLHWYRLGDSQQYNRISCRSHVSTKWGPFHSCVVCTGSLHCYLR